MYVVIGVYPDRTREARLEYATLEEAITKLRDLVGADDIDNNGPMFCEYTIIVERAAPGGTPADQTLHLRR